MANIDWSMMVTAEQKHAEANERLKRAVNAEHDRRILEGKAFDLDGYGEVHPDGSPDTRIVLLALKDTARDLKAAGVTDPVLMFTDNAGDHYLTADQMIQLVDDGKVWMQAMHAAKRALKEMGPIPADYADDTHWPD